MIKLSFSFCRFVAKIILKPHFYLEHTECFFGVYLCVKCQAKKTEEKQNREKKTPTKNESTNYPRATAKHVYTFVSWRVNGRALYVFVCIRS